MVSWKNAAETFGILIGGIYQKRQTRRDGIEVLGYSTPGGAAGTNGVPTLIGSPLFTQERERYGANNGLQFRPSDAIEINVTGPYSRFNADNFNQNYLAWPARPLGDGGALTHATVGRDPVVEGPVHSRTARR